jgi:flagellar protein FlaI
MSSGTAESADERAGRSTDREALSGRIGAASEDARALAAVVDARTVRTNPELDEDAFFTTADGRTTIANRYDLERAVALERKPHLREVERYWVNEPYSFVVVFHSEKENERKYYAVEPHLTPIELDLQEFLAGKLRAAIKYSDDEVVVRGDDADRAGVIERETERLLDRYDLYAGPVRGGHRVLRA